MVFLMITACMHGNLHAREYSLLFSVTFFSNMFNIALSAFKCQFNAISVLMYSDSHSIAYYLLFEVPQNHILSEHCYSMTATDITMFFSAGYQETIFRRTRAHLS